VTAGNFHELYVLGKAGWVSHADLMVTRELVAPANASELMDVALLQLERSSGMPG
jgi:hypothetical protein